MHSDAAGPLLELRDIVVRYPRRRSLGEVLHRRPNDGVEAVRGVSLDIDRGELVAIVGESGCGKTSLVSALLGLAPRSGGTVRFAGREVPAGDARALRLLQREIQLVWQDPYASLDPRFRVIDTVEEPLIVHRVGGSRSERRALALDALERAGLAPASAFAQRHPHQLSGGQRQRVAIAAAIGVRPQLLLADEPVSMLDVSVRAGILTLLDELRGGGLGIAMITHDLSTAAQFADRIVVMYLGAIVEEGPAEQVTTRPAHPYTRALVAAAGSPDPSAPRERIPLTGAIPDPEAAPDGCLFSPRCPFVTEACRAARPAHRPLAGAPDRRVACIHPLAPLAAVEAGPAEGEG